MTGAALLFDLDGCLIDSLPAIRTCWERTLTQAGEPMPDPEQMRELAGPPVDRVARGLLGDVGGERIAEVVAAYRRCSVALAAEVPTYDGVPELLGELSARGVALAIATSKSIEVAEPVLEARGLRGYFTAVEGTRLDELGADKATVVDRALAALAPLRPLGLVGDRAHDVVGAHAHGLRAFGALWGYGGREELQAAGADVLLDAPGDVIALL